MDNTIVTGGVVDFDALDTAVDTDSQDASFTLEPFSAQRIGWWEWPTMGVVGALLGAAVYFSAVTPWPGV
ncbi:hypothetical protein CH300_19980 [Rhodococcus sp. 15-1154-1]|nr:hypothetical protein [Rhodococcus sp. 15-1154-1]OZF00824.1 hypothetical protein CH300_19980 [Rhodococcus sp. 15-1154-1]